MASNDIPDSPASPEPPQVVQPSGRASTSFEDRFQQLLCVELSPKLWLTVQRAKSSNGATYIDLRRRMERVINGAKTQIPTKLGLFLRYNEYDMLKQKLVNPPGDFELALNNGRQITGRYHGRFLEIHLKAGHKESKIGLDLNEIGKIVSHSIPNHIFAAMQEIIWE